MEPALDDAIRLHKSGNHAGAEPLYRAVLDRDPANRGALQMLAMLLVQTGRPAEAVGHFQTILRLEPGAVAGYSNLAAALRLAGQGAEAIACLHRALALDPAHAASWFNLGNGLKQLEKAAGAARSYQRTLAVEPGHAGAVGNRKTLRDQWGPRLDEAERQAAAARHPSADADARAAAAEALLAVGDAAAAETMARAALDRDDRNHRANRLLGRLLLERSGAMDVRSGKPFAVDRSLVEEAIGALRRAVAVRPDDDEADWLHVAAVATLVQVGMASEAVLRDGARAAWVRLRRHPKDTVAASVIGFHVYRRDRLVLASWLSRRFRRRFTAAEVAREHELGLWTMLRADDAFFRTLPLVDAVLEGMAPLEWRIEPAPGPAGEPATEPAVFFCCDDVYFRRFAPALLESLAERMPGAAVAVHVVAPSPETEQAMARWRTDGRLRVGFSLDRPDMAGWADVKRVTYYASARFLHALQWLRRLDRPLMVIDTDARVAQDLRALSVEMAGHDVGFLVDGRRRGPSREITVCFNVYNNTPGGDRFLSLLGAYIGHFLAGAEVYWMLDQMAHYAVLDWLKRHEPIRVRRFDFLNFPYCHFVGAK
ncbi:tetratricopeptide repeat protein (plasmid) [Azospirillum argentinense]|uniref:Tetratricopeptide repeat protein n=1 Tax=Azospirillum argentinense TaxID=2970906 RepID=A0A4D8PHE1_9PROT|nr:tetratricopeptide repeat protein [Azospirillum argentinense]QCN96814.1 tetratricopeptide repeat protein [Azospirillum argentinense]